ncbi:MAG: hypothetical protein Q7U42_14895, partial [Parvibaculum sp.]|nr:hypothetical protein [Parvibaculum sp.]
MIAKVRRHSSEVFDMLPRITDDGRVAYRFGGQRIFVGRSEAEKISGKTEIHNLPAAVRKQFAQPHCTTNDPVGKFRKIAIAKNRLAPLDLQRRPGILQ